MLQPVGHDRGKGVSQGGVERGVMQNGRFPSAPIMAENGRPGFAKEHQGLFDPLEPYDSYNFFIAQTSRCKTVIPTKRLIR